MQKSMSIKWLLLTALIVFVYLIIVNATVFPYVFQDGLAEKFHKSRAQPLPLFHVFAFAATAILLTRLVEKLFSHSSNLTHGALAGGLLGLLVALPEHLHLNAMVDATITIQFIPALWTVITWGIAGLLVSLVRQKVTLKQSSGSRHGNTT